MSLMIGLIIFISGVETAKDIKVILLPYVINSDKFFLYPGWLYGSCNSFALFLPGCIFMDAM